LSSPLLEPCLQTFIKFNLFCNNWNDALCTNPLKLAHEFLNLIKIPVSDPRYQILNATLIRLEEIFSCKGASDTYLRIKSNFCWDTVNNFATVTLLLFLQIPSIVLLFISLLIGWKSFSTGYEMLYYEKEEDFYQGPQKLAIKTPKLKN